MRIIRSTIVLLIAFAVLFTVAGAQTPPAGGQRGARGGDTRGGDARGGDARGGDARGGRGGRGGGGGGGIQIMNLVTTAWPDGGMIPLRYTQAGGELSPAIQWSNVPGPAAPAADGTQISTKSF